MNKRQAQRYNHLVNALERNGFETDEVDKLLRIEKVLHTWAEHECNGEIQRDEDTNIPYWYNTNTGKKLSRAADRETGALKRAKDITEAHNCQMYHQGDPRGCALYVLPPGTIPEGADVGAYYSRGIAMCTD